MLKKKKSKAITKNPNLKWLCFVCHDHKSTKTLGHVINAVTLKCSLCNEYLKYHSRSDNYKDGLAVCTRCTNGIALPLCGSCGEPMKEFNGTLNDLKANQISNDDPRPIRKKKKSFW